MNPKAITDATGQFLFDQARRFVRRLGPGREATDDCVAEFVARGVQVRTRESAASRPLLVRSGQNAVRDYLRHERRVQAREAPPEAAALIPDPRPTPHVHLLGSTFRQAVAVAIQQLTERQRTVFHWHVQEAASFREIAERLGTTEGAARQTFFQTRQRLQTLLTGDGWSEGFLREFIAESARKN